ncbi:putative DNA ligase [Pseudomonas phage PspYZU05]|uniref:Putative DNA ligase n=1 Tax=Pseudomonas phage PspYZU05 TaxID=1983556 RepID=A0A2U7NS30_9CAUD|nr:putative DNA ligase [Pseudomonas phage PspYZU05]ASD52162.1 putative DNA ligase [Pseudomonas phage PspYZU05]
MAGKMIKNILDDLAKDNSTKRKEQVMRSHESNSLLRKVYLMAYSRRIAYNIKQIPTQTKEGNTDLDTALDQVMALHRREYTGHAARDYLLAIINSVSSSDAEVIRRVIIRDLECGASRTLANKVWPGLCPEQPQQLASSFSEKAAEKFPMPAIAELKADGARAFAELTSVDGELSVNIVSRAGNEYHGLDKLKKEIIELLGHMVCEDGYPEGVMLDGELEYEVKRVKSLFDDEEPADEGANRTLSNGIANKSLSNTISKEEADNMHFRVWDLVPMKEVYAETSLPDSERSIYIERSNFLNGLISAHKPTLINAIERTMVYSLAEAKAIYKGYVDRGYEGIILKRPDAFWENARSKNLLKFKEVFSIDLRCIDKYPHSKDPNKLGGIIAVSECGKIKVDVGSGFKDTKGQELDRTALMQEDITDVIFECECNGLVDKKTRKPGDPVSLFLGVVKRIRRDKDKANTLEEVFGEQPNLFK